MKQVYHSWEKWEDNRHGFYDSCSAEERSVKLNKVVEMFNSKELTDKFMQRIINEWKYACEHNLSNPSMNRVAWLGQSACCLYAQIPSTVTMEAWSLLTPEVQERSNAIAERKIKQWEAKQNSTTQLCIELI